MSDAFVSSWPFFDIATIAAIGRFALEADILVQVTIPFMVSRPDLSMADLVHRLKAGYGVGGG